MFVEMTNVHAKGGYCIGATIGSESVPVQLIVDTGSSTLVVAESAWNPGKDRDLTPTSWVQDVTYGMGGWAGPLVRTTVQLNSQRACMRMKDVPVAMASVVAPGVLADADGFIGLAYHHLDKSYDVSQLLAGLDPPAHTTWPWPFDVGVQSDDLRAFRQQLAGCPEQDVEPYFDDLTEHGLISNRFGFVSSRSSIHHCAADLSRNALARDPLNQGQLVLGNDCLEDHLYQGDFIDLAVNHDIYYNVTLESAGFAGGPMHEAPPLDAAHLNSYFSNAIIDTGASMLVLVADLYQALHQDLLAMNPSFGEVLDAFPDQRRSEIGIDIDRVTLSEWPDLLMTFSGPNHESHTLSLSADTYWQVHAPEHGQITYKLLPQIAHWPNQSIIGLPLLNNYYVMFDRSNTELGRVRFARVPDQ